MRLDMSKPSLKMRAVKAMLDDAPAGPKREDAAKHFLAAEQAHIEMTEAKTNRELDATIRALAGSS